MGDLCGASVNGVCNNYKFLLLSDLLCSPYNFASVTPYCNILLRDRLLFMACQEKRFLVLAQCFLLFIVSFCLEKCPNVSIECRFDRLRPRSTHEKIIFVYFINAPSCYS